MKILTIHSDFIQVELKSKAIETAEEGEKGETETGENVLVVFTAVEKNDEKNKENVVEQTVTEIQKIFEKVNAEEILIYPYAHLSSDLAGSSVAKGVLSKIYKGLKDKDLPTKKVAFGWYKAFELSCKGHPLSELSREITGEKKESEALEKEEEVKSYWHILTPEGELVPVDEFDFSEHENLKKFAEYEMEGSRKVKEEPPHVKLMRELELADYEPASDSGNLRYYPKGRLIKSLLEKYVTDRVIDYGGVEVETPIMYDVNHPTLSKYLQRFPARQYRIESDKKEFFLRFSACFGQFLIAHDATISYKNLPLKLYELTRYSFRKEQKGELTGLRRLRAFTMPDVHAICRNLDQAIGEYKTRYKLCLDVLNRIGLSKDDFELGIRVTKDFYENNKELVTYLVKKLGKPALVEVWDNRFFYFTLKYEFNFVDNLDKASSLSTDQIDVENGERYNITFKDKDGKDKHPLILHCSPSGAIERVMYALLEKSAKEKKRGEFPILPLWLAPTQVRLCTVSDEYIEYSKTVAETLERENIRVDIDDRVESVSRKVRDSEMEWIPYTLVIGGEEKASGKFVVRKRETGEEVKMELEDLIEEIKGKIKDYPYQALPLPKLVSKRPKFFG